MSPIFRVEMLTPAERKRALLLGTSAWLAALVWFVLAALLPAAFKLEGLRTGAMFLVVAAAGSVGWSIPAVRKLSVARDRQFDLRGWIAAALAAVAWLWLLLTLVWLAIGLFVAVTGQRFTGLGR